MKKTKALATLLVALTLLTPLVAVQACSEKSDDSSYIGSAESFDSSDFSVSTDKNSSSKPDSSSSQPSGGNGESNTGNTGTNGSTSGGISGGASNGNTSNSGATSTPTKTYAKYIRCTGDSVNIRSGAGTGYAVLGSAKKGTMYAIVGQTGSWYKTYYRNQTAYIYASYATVLSLEKTKDEDVENVIEEGYKLLGVPYVYGAVRLHDGNGKLLSGFTAQKFDCSSLIQYVFYKGAGTLLNTNTRTQVKHGKYVAKSDLKRGDCLFFTNEDRQYNTGVERIGHVALYLGNDYILHTASDYARIEKMTTSRWNFYVEARRFL